MRTQKAVAAAAAVPAVKLGEAGLEDNDVCDLGHCVEHVDPFAFPTAAHQTSAVRGTAPPRTWTDVELVGYALRRAARAAQKGYMLISAEYYALTYKILCKKCDVIEKLVRMAVKYCEDNVAEQDATTQRDAVAEAVSPGADVTAGMRLMLLPPGLDQEDYEAERHLHEQGTLIRDVIAQQQQRERYQQRMTVAMQWLLATLHKVHPDALPLSTLETCVPDFLRVALQPAAPRAGVEPTARTAMDDLTPFMPTLKTAEAASGERGSAAGSGLHGPSMNTEATAMTSAEETNSGNATADEPARGFSLTLLFAVLLWNTANTMWQDGYIAHAAVWLRAVDVTKLQQLLTERVSTSAEGSAVAQGVTANATPQSRSHDEKDDDDDDGDGETWSKSGGDNDKGNERLYELSWRALLTSTTPQVSPAASPMTSASARTAEMPSGRITLPVQAHSGLTSPTGESTATTTRTAVPLSSSNRATAGQATTTAVVPGATPLPPTPAEAARQLRRLCQRLLHHVTALRDLCAIIEACETTEDVLSYVRALDAAVRAWHSHTAQPRPRRVRYQARRHPVLEQTSSSPNVTQKTTDAATSVEQSQQEGAADCMAEILVTLNIVVEFFLSRRAVRRGREMRAQRARQAKLLAHSDSYARLFDLNEDHDITAATQHSQTAQATLAQDTADAHDDTATAIEADFVMSAKEEDEAVRAACDELVRAFTAGYYDTVEALETDGLPAHEAATTVLAPGLSYTLAVNVLSSTLNYVSMFRLSKIHRGVLTAASRQGSEPYVAPFIFTTDEVRGPPGPAPTSQEPQTEVMRRESPRRALSSASRGGTNEGEVCSPANMAPTSATAAAAQPLRTADTTSERAAQVLQTVHTTRARLRLPSRAAVGGLSLLAEEPLVVQGGRPYAMSVPLDSADEGGEQGEEADEMSLRLLVLLHRYRSCHTLERVPPHVVVFTTQELNKALFLLQAQMRRHLGEAWATGWQSQYHDEMHHFYFTALGRVCEVDRGSALGGCVSGRSGASRDATSAVRETQAPHGSTTTATTRQAPAPSASVHPEKDALSPWWARPLQKMPSVDTLHRRREASASATSHSSATTFAHELEPVTNSGSAAAASALTPSESSAVAGQSQGAAALAPVTAMWDLPPAYIPDITVDFSAFTTSSLETQLATRQMVAERIRRQKELQAGQLSEVDRNNITGVSLLSAACRQLLHDALPIPSQYSPWRVIYSTALHGVSLQTLLKNCEREQSAASGLRPLPHWQAASPVGRAERGFLSSATGAEAETTEPRPMLLVMELTPSTTFSFAADGAGVREAAASAKAGSESTPHKPTHRLIIGAYLSHLLCRESRRYYGNAETFVFQLLLPDATPPPSSSSSASKSGLMSSSSPPAGPAQPQLRTYHASGHNAHFINCRSSSIVVGGGGMGSSLFIDDSLWHGATAACATFKAAPPLTEWVVAGGEAKSSGRGESSSAAVSFEILHLEVIVIDS